MFRIYFPGQRFMTLTDMGAKLRQSQQPGSRVTHHLVLCRNKKATCYLCVSNHTRHIYRIQGGIIPLWTSHFKEIQSVIKVFYVPSIR